MFVRPFPTTFPTSIPSRTTRHHVVCWSLFLQTRTAASRRKCGDDESSFGGGVACVFRRITPKCRGASVRGISLVLDGAVHRLRQELVEVGLADTRRAVHREHQRFRGGSPGGRISRPPASRSRRSARGGGRADAREGERTPALARAANVPSTPQGARLARAARKTPRWPPRPPHRNAEPRAPRRCGWRSLRMATAFVVNFRETLTKTAARRAPPPLFAAAAFGARRGARVTHPRARTRDTRRIAWDPNARFGPAQDAKGARGASRGTIPPRVPREEAVVVGTRRMRRRARPRRRPRRDRRGPRRDRDTERARRETRFSTRSARSTVRHRARAVRGEPPGHGDVRDRLRGAGVPDLRLHAEMRREAGGAAAWRRGRPGHLRAGVPRRPHVRRDRLDDRRLQAHAQAVRVPIAPR